MKIFSCAKALSEQSLLVWMTCMRALAQATGASLCLHVGLSSGIFPVQAITLLPWAHLDMFCFSWYCVAWSHCPWKGRIDRPCLDLLALALAAIENGIRKFFERRVVFETWEICIVILVR